MDVVSYVKLKAMETLLNGAVNDTVVIPVDVQARLQQTIQTQTGVVLAPAASNTGTFIDCDGFDSVVLSTMGSIVGVRIDWFWSHDGTTNHFNVGESKEDATQSNVNMVVPVKARYLKVSITNKGAAPNTMSAWAFLKA